MNFERHQQLHEKRKLKHLPLTFIVSLHLIYRGQFLIFERDDNMVGPVSGKIETDESYVDAAVRELDEETALKLPPDHIHQTAHSFHSVSPKGKDIFGISMFASLECRCFDFLKINLNSELLDFQLVSPDLAIRKIERYGHPESLVGIKHVLNSFLATKR